MKNSILLTAVLLAFVTMGSASDPVNNIESCCPVVYESATVELSYDIDLFSEHFSPAYYNKETNALHFEGKDDISFVKVFNEQGVMEYQLPVMSNKVRISKNMFSKGEYKLTFVFDEQSPNLDTYVRIN